MSKIITIPRHSGGPVFVNRQNAVNWDHPLNEGLILWALPVHGETGNTIQNLVSGQSAAITAATWAAGINGFRALDFAGNGNPDRVNFGPVPGSAASDLTLSLWVYMTTLATDQKSLITKFQSGTGDRVFLWRVETSGTIQLLTHDGASQTILNSTTPVNVMASNLNAWHMLGLTYDRSAQSATFYLDGIPLLDSGTTLSLTQDVATDVMMGTWLSGATAQDEYQGRQTDGRLKKVLSSADQMHDLYIESLRGHPYTFNRRPITYFIPVVTPTPGTFFPYFY